MMVVDAVDGIGTGGITLNPMVVVKVQEGVGLAILARRVWRLSQFSTRGPGFPDKALRVNSTFNFQYSTLTELQPIAS